MVDAQKVSRVLGEMLTMGANVNMYVSPNIILPRFPPLCTDVVKHNSCPYPVISSLSAESMKSMTTNPFIVPPEDTNLKLT